MNPDGSNLFQITNLPTVDNMSWFPDLGHGVQEELED
jgi:hypothetical protein